MIKALLLLLGLCLPVTANLQQNVQRTPLQASHTQANEQIQIDGVVTYEGDNEYLFRDGETYDALVNDNIRVYYSGFSTESRISYSLNNLYAEFIQQVSVDDGNGYLDFHLIGSGETIFMIHEIDAYNQIIGYDSVKLNIEEEATSYELQTVSPYYYSTKTLTLKFLVNGKNTIFDPNAYLYYYEGDKQVMLLNCLDENNQFQVFFDDKLSSFDELTLFVSNGSVTSEGVKLMKKDVTFISYFDIINTHQIYLLSDKKAEFYVRIPKHSNPEFSLLENKKNIDLLSYEVTEEKETYDVVTFRIQLNKADTDFEVVLGSLTYDENGLYRRGYNYKNFHMTIIEKVETVEIVSGVVDKIGYDETVTFKASINGIEGVDCNLEWLLDDEAVYQGKEMTMNFQNSGNHVLKVRYAGVEALLAFTVAYSTLTTVIWYAGFFALVIVGTILLVAVSRLKRKRRKLFLPYEIPTNKTNKLMEGFTSQASNKDVDRLVRQMKTLVDELGVYDISDDSVSFESLITNCRNEVQVIKNFKKCPEDKKDILYGMIKENWTKIYSMIQEFTLIIQKKEGNNG